MTYQYSELDAEFTLRAMHAMPAPQSQPCDDAIWWTPDGLATWDDVQSWYQNQTYRNCPYYIACNGGPDDLPGRFGPGTCGGSCWEEPECMTSWSQI